MSSIRLRLIAILLATTGAVWCCAVFWTYLSTQHQVERVLDARLTEAARMVSSLITDHHVDVAAAVEAATASDAPPGFTVAQGDYSRQLSCQIWSLQGQLVSRSDSAPKSSLADHESGFEDTVINGERWRVYAVVNPKLGVRVLVGDSLEMRDRLVGDVVKGQLVPALAILPILAALIWFSVDRGLAPLSRIASTLSGRSADVLHPIEEGGTPREVRPLLGSLNALFHRVSEAREREKTFIAYAAHELKTPLAGLKTQAQIALRSDDGDTRNAALRHISTSVDRAGRLVRQLIDMAAVDSADGDPSRDAIDVGAILREISGDLENLRAARNVSVNVRVGAAVGTTYTDRMLLNLAVKNVLENAILHASQDSHVDLLVEQEAEELRIEVIDPGPGMTPAEAKHLMGRFNRGSREGEGTGLGLSIVEMATHKLGAQLAFEQREDGFCARISLPISAD
ncbi:two-component system sensor histidine kinase QseC [Mycoplana sp. BE70]|uniref:ATP-binding protein n=1 Tax=Mycoplana sp. BE70 TaxID=2817775 RepID=UPI002859480A|nr:ATP-binding protein [Mycoplana sp. BE70]MDR6759184.1 two-component system sensor histidine kinase QseC [Mycoplana sp. BE70]